MLKYILKRLGVSVLILLGVSVILYVLLRCMPASYVDQRIVALNQAGGASEELIAQLKHAYGLDTSIIQGYFNWLGNVFKLDFGKSFQNNRPVIQEIFNKDRIGTSFIVAAISTVFEFLIAIPLGITAATHQYSIRDYVEIGRAHV